MAGFLSCVRVQIYLFNIVQNIIKLLVCIFYLRIKFALTDYGNNTNFWRTCMHIVDYIWLYMYGHNNMVYYHDKWFIFTGYYINGATILTDWVEISNTCPNKLSIYFLCNKAKQILRTNLTSWAYFDIFIVHVCRVNSI